MIKEHDLIILKSRIGNIFSNSIGTVVHVYPNESTNKKYVVEFVGEDASTILDLFDYQIQKFEINREENKHKI